MNTFMAGLWTDPACEALDSFALSLMLTRGVAVAVYACPLSLLLLSPLPHLCLLRLPCPGPLSRLQ